MQPSPFIYCGSLGVYTGEPLLKQLNKQKINHQMPIASITTASCFLFIYRSGNPIPNDLDRMASVSHGKAFILLGGVSSGSLSLALLEFDPDTENWIIRSEQLATGRNLLGAVLVDQSIVNCSMSTTTPITAKISSTTSTTTTLTTTTPNTTAKTTTTTTTSTTTTKTGKWPEQNYSLNSVSQFENLLFRYVG